MTKINVINVTDMAVDVDVDMVADMDTEMYSDVAITTHLFMSPYQKWPT
jgi:hypothetical protein